MSELLLRIDIIVQKRTVGCMNCCCLGSMQYNTIVQKKSSPRKTRVGVTVSKKIPTW